MRSCGRSFTTGRGGTPGGDFLGYVFGILLVLFGFMLGLCWVSGPSPESDVLCFQSLLGYIHHMEFFGAFRPLGGRLPLGKVASFGAPARGE